MSQLINDKGNILDLISFCRIEEAHKHTILFLFSLSHSHTLYDFLLIIAQHAWCMFNSTPCCEENAVHLKSSKNLFRIEKAMAGCLLRIDPALMCLGGAGKHGVCADEWIWSINKAVC